VTTFVLLHGAWHGGWCWSRVADPLRAEGHTVDCPTFTGVSDRAHVLSPSVGLSTHVEDVVRLLDFEDLHDVVLVGHSYAGLVVSGVAQRRPGRLRLRVHLDAFLPRDGEAGIDLLPERVAHHYREAVAGPGFGWLIPPRSLEVLGVTEQADLDWLTPRLTPHPWLTYTEPIRLGPEEAEVPGVFVECTDWMRVFQPYAERARQRGWPVHEVPTGHEAMVTAPAALAKILLEVAGA
jgi:pimeloyl-ACP methyl ester carboxylesterase